MTKELMAEEKEIGQFIKTLIVNLMWSAKDKSGFRDALIEKIPQWHKSECKKECRRFALECVPEKPGIIQHNDDFDNGFDTGVNYTVDNMIKNIEDKSK